MGFFRLLAGLYLGWLVIKAARRFVAKSLVNDKVAESKIDDAPSVKTLELMPCPHCGVYTTVPCTNPECMKN